MPIPRESDFNILFPDESTCVNYLIQNSVFYREFDCPRCSNPMSRHEHRGVFRCLRRSCRKYEVSMRIGTFFHKHSIGCLQILRLARLWLTGIRHKSAVLLTGHSPKTVTSFYFYFSQLVASSLTEYDMVIGGENVIVEVDETKLGKRKYHRGHRVDGVWVICGIERTPESRCFCVAMDDRSAETIRDVISRHVRQGSILYTDRWKGYSSIEESLGMRHMSVNHSLYFKDPMTGVNTNKVEGLNGGVKRAIPERNRVKNGIEDRLATYIWRKRNAMRLWGAFFDALREIHYE